MTIGSLINWAKDYLSESESAVLDSRILLAFCLEQELTYLLTWPDKSVATNLVLQFQNLVKRRGLGHPIAHLVGYRDFWTLRLKVNASTLIPRPETELLVEQCLTFDLPDSAKVLDLGCGTGAIALALASERPNWQVIGVDMVTQAVELASQNAQLNHIENAAFIQSHWFDAISDQQFDLIVSNPPYVESTSKFLARGDVRFEPKSALTAGDDGLDDIRVILERAPEYLKTHGKIAFEHGFNQGEQVCALLKQSGFTKVNLLNDLNQLPRVTFASYE